MTLSIISAFIITIGIMEINGAFEKRNKRLEYKLSKREFNKNKNT